MNRAPNHHPADTTLLRFAAGRLPAGESLVVATHLPFCPCCRADVRLGEDMGGSLLAGQPEVALAPDALSRALDRLDATAGAARPPAVPENIAPGVPLPASLLGTTRSPWRWVAPGISRALLEFAGSGPGELAYLLRAAPGKILPEHGHRGRETTCILTGSFTDATGTYGPGDVAEMNGEASHQPVSGTDGPCVCLIVCEGKLRMRGLLARLIQPLIGV